MEEKLDKYEIQEVFEDMIEEFTRFAGSWRASQKYYTDLQNTNGEDCSDVIEVVVKAAEKYELRVKALENAIGRGL